VEPFGYGGPNSLFGLVQRRHMVEHGTTVEALGRIAVAFRQNAALTDHALLRNPMTVEEYLNSRLISDPIRLYDCVMPCDGGAAVVVASERRAREFTDRPIYLVADAERTNHRGGLLERTETGFSALAEPLFSVVPREQVDFAELYDDYPIAVLMQLQDLGFYEKGQGVSFIQAHDFTVHGDFPINTGGGQLSRGQPGLAGGHLHVVEALRQLKGEAGRNQVRKARTALVTGLGLLGYNINVVCCAALILQRREA
jgi:acetyl-CoA acetyltransferase